MVLNDNIHSTLVPWFKTLKFLISYKIDDPIGYDIATIALQLENKNRIKKVFYYERDCNDNIYVYMNKVIAKVHLILVFCSPEALKSPNAELEWMNGHKLGAKILPIFKDVKDIPPLLTTFEGVQYRDYDLEGTIEDIYSLAKKKIYF